MGRRHRDPGFERSLIEDTGFDDHEPLHLAVGKRHARRSGSGQGVGLQSFADSYQKAALTHGANQHVAVERKTDAAEHADLAAVGIGRKDGANAICQMAHFDPDLTPSFIFSAEYGRDAERPQFTGNCQTT